MRAFLLTWIILQNMDSGWGQGCVQATDYVCNQIPTDYPPGVSSLVLLVNDMRVINSTVFNYTNLFSVSSLTLTQSGVVDIAPGAFAQFQQLKTLNLENNVLSHVTSAWFIYKEVLERFTLSNNSIKSLNTDSFLGLLGLLSLNLSQNQIHTVTAGSFQSLINLRHLDLSNNKLRHLSVDTLIPLDQTNTRIHLNGNPWDCSCSVYKFAEYLRELQSVSRLPNEMEVLCESPPDQRGTPVWNVSRCINPTTAVRPTTGYNETLTSGLMTLPVLISLIVVLCALVLVICVLSVLYHKKQERKLLLTIQPSAEEQESTDRVQPDNRSMMKSVFCDQKIKQPNRILSKQDQMVKEPERVSHIYQMYSPGIYPMIETTTRSRSAGPVLSRNEDFCLREKTQVEQDNPGVRLVKDHLSYVKCIETEAEQKKKKLNYMMAKSKREEKEGLSNDKDNLARTIKMQKEHPHLKVHDGASDLKTNFIYKQNLMVEGKNSDGNTSKEDTGQEFLLYSDDVMPHYKAVQDKTSSLARPETLQKDNEDTDQPLEDVENIPYLTIGADPDKQSSKIRAEVSTKQVNVRPIIRVQTWPPTAAQWKKQWTQNQQVPNVSPNLIITHYMYQVSMFPSSNHEMLPQGSRVLPEPQSPMEDRDFKPVGISRELCKSDVQSYSQGFSSGRSEEFRDLNEHSNTNSNLLLNNVAHSDLVSSSPLFKRMTTRAEEGIINTNKRTLAKQTSSIQKKRTQPTKREQARSKSAIQSMKKDWEGRKAQGKKPRSLACSESSSGAPPSGGSPSDGNLLMGNEYTLDLLHEVVEKHGRWTRERWKQSHSNKKKKQLATSH